MLKVLIASCKGGCGKTTLATHLAAHYAVEGKNTVLVDCDKLASSRHWCERRAGLASAVLPIDGTKRNWRERIPDGAHASVCVFTVLLPGVPYAVINYILPVVGVPLRTFILCAWPLHTLRSTVTVIFGDQSAHLTATRLVVLMAYALMILGASWWTYRRLQSQFSSPSRAANGRKQPA